MPNIGKIEFTVPRRVGKTQPGVSDVHAPTALGNQGPKRKAKDFLTVIGEMAGGAKVMQLPVLEVGKKDGLTTVWFMRHGATRFNNQTDMSQDRVRSWNDVPLTQEGKDDATKAGEKLAKDGIGIIVSSSLGRAKMTAKLVKAAIGDPDIEVVSTPKMLPWNLGKFTGQTTDEAHDGIKHYIENPDEVVPDGESFNDFRSRACQGMLWALKKAGKRKMLAISHHRNERLWATSGKPPSIDAEIDAEKFLKPGEDPGDVTTFDFDPKLLKCKKADDNVGKVYDSNADLPDNVRGVLPDHAQTVFRRVFNDRVKAGAGEDSARRQAWTAVKNGWRKGDDGQWVRKFAGDDEALIVFTDQQIALAKQLPSDAIQGPGAPNPNNASLHLYPLDSDPAWAKTPFPWDQNALGNLKPDQMKPLLGALTNQDALPVRLFHMKTVVALQDRVNPDKVQSMVDDEPDDLPVVARLNGRNLLIDGHHRATARTLMGRKTMQVHFINLDDPSAEAKEDDAEVRAKKRGRTFGEVIKGWFSKDPRPIPVSYGKDRIPAKVETFRSFDKKDDGFSRAFEVKKIDEDQQLVFGWASIWTVDGEYVVDKQDDIIPPDEGEKAAYDFVLYHRSQGDMHERQGVGRCIESMVFTKQKQDALGIDLGMEAWWVGFKVDDAGVWKRIKAGDLPEFSIGGKASREAA